MNGCISATFYVKVRPDYFLPIISDIIKNSKKPGPPREREILASSQNVKERIRRNHTFCNTRDGKQGHIIISDETKIQ